MRQSVLRAAAAGAAAMAVFGAVEIGFGEIAVWAFHRSGFAPLDAGFALVLFLLYPLAGAAGAALLTIAARTFGLRPHARAAGAAVVLALHAAFRLDAFAGGSHQLLAGMNALLFAAALAGVFSEELGERLRLLTGPWVTALLLLGPAWVMTDLLADAARPVRALGFLASAAALVAAALGIARVARGAALPAAAGAAAVAVALAAVALVGPDPPRQAPVSAAAARGPNVLLVVLDTVRADHLRLYGYGRDTMPRLGRFASLATVYTRAIAPSNMTLATHATLFTGRSGTEHRAHYDAGRPAGRPLGTGFPTLAEVLAARGYDASSVAGNYGFLGAGFGLNRGFLWVDARPRRSTLGVIPAASVRGAARRLLCRVLRAAPETDTRARGAAEITDLAIARIDRARALSRPYFLFVNYFDAHERVLLPPPFAGAFSARPARATGVLYDTLLRGMNATGRVAIPERDRADLVARYDETLAYLDASLDRLLAKAAGAGGEADTWIVVTSDHGEAWGEHDSIGHGSTLYQEQLHVPLLVRAPGQAAGRVVDEPVGLAAVFGLLAGAQAEARAEAPGGSVVAESFPLVPTPEKPGVHGGRALFAGDRVLLRGIDGRVALYDPWRDPGETRDLSASPEGAVEAARLGARLDAWIAAHPPDSGRESSESREDRARLRALGYLR